MLPLAVGAHGTSFPHWGLYFLLRNMGTRCSFMDSKNRKKSYFHFQARPCAKHLLHYLYFTRNVCETYMIIARFAET